MNKAGTIKLGFVDTVGVKQHTEFLPGLEAVDDADVWFMLRDLLLEPMGIGRPVRRSLAMRALREVWDRPGGSDWRAWRDEWWEQVATLIKATATPPPSTTRSDQLPELAPERE